MVPKIVLCDSSRESCSIMSDDDDYVYVIILVAGTVISLSCYFCYKFRNPPRPSEDYQEIRRT